MPKIEISSGEMDVRLLMWSLVLYALSQRSSNIDKNANDVRKFGHMAIDIVAFRVDLKNGDAIYPQACEMLEKARTLFPRDSKDEMSNMLASNASGVVGELLATAFLAEIEAMGIA